MNSEYSPSRDDLLSQKQLGRFVQRLRSFKRQRVPLSAIWQSYQRVYGQDAAGLDARAELKAILSHLRDIGVCNLPAESGQAWDRASVVMLPNWVRVLDDKAEANERQWRRFPWHPALAWVPQLLSLSGEQEAFLMRVQRALVEGTFAQRAPFKYRSLQLTGHEKRLAALLGTQLFGKGRLSLELLNCDGLGLPLTFERFHSVPHMIVFENAGSFIVARRVLKALANPPYGAVAYGGGTQILRATDYLDQCEDLQTVKYVGDLDAKGIEIGAAFAARVNEAGRHAVGPAVEVHLAMLAAAAELMHPDGWPASGKRQATDATQWLSPQCLPQVNHILAQGRRIPEEVLHDGHYRDLWG